MKILIIQTAFIGDVILATSLLESVHHFNPEFKVSILVKRGTETLFNHHPFLNKVMVLNKGKGKWKNVLQLIQDIRNEKFDYVINLQRFFTSGLLTILSKAETKIGYKKSPCSSLFNLKYPHHIGKKGDSHYLHEIDRNFKLIQSLGVKECRSPRLYPSQKDEIPYNQYTKNGEFITISPASIWFTKQFPKSKWIEFICSVPAELEIFLIGGKSDYLLCEGIISECPRKSGKIHNLSGKLSFLESAVFYKNAKMNFVNDSAPLHICSAMNANVSSLFCSTIPEFGFGPIHSNGSIIQIEIELPCKPCGLHGKKACPEGHFKCALDVKPVQLLEKLN